MYNIDKLWLTHILFVSLTAGKKNETILEQEINKDSNKKNILVNPTKFDANIKEVRMVSIKPEKYNETVVNNPYYVKDGQVVGQDYLGIKDKLEDTFFGKTYDDNIHIQIAYKLLDIRKIMGMSVGSAVFSLNNLQQRPVGENPNDIVGQIKTDTSFDEIPDNYAKADKDFIDILLDYTRYFDNVFEKQSISVDDKTKDILNNLKECETVSVKTVGTIDRINKNDPNNNNYTIFKIGGLKIKLKGILSNVDVGTKLNIEGQIRRNNDYRDKKGKLCRSYSLLTGAKYSISHEVYNPDTYTFNYDILRLVSYLRQAVVHNNNDDYIDWLYSIDNKKETKDILNAANKVFESQLEAFNKDFNANAQKNVYMIASVLNDSPKTMFKEEIKDIYEKYYNFVLFKENRNVGINLRNIRNNIFYEDIKPNYDEKELSRERAKINTLLDYFIYQDFNNNEKLAEDVIARLQPTKQEVDKVQVYADVTKEFKVRNPKLVDRILSTVKNTIEAKIENFIPDNCVPSSSIKVSSLAKYVYVLAKFLDTKEVNNLLTSLINSFENIGSLVKVLKDEKGYSIYKDRFALLNQKNPFDLANDFILVKNLATMKTKLAKANVKDVKNKVGKRLYCSAINLFKDKNDEVILDNQEFEDIMSEFSSNVGNKKNRRGTAGSKIRNFLINNVIDSRRFYFIIKYYDTRRCHEIIQNENLVRFILGREDMPTDQLIRYYKTITGNECNNRNQIIDTLVKKLKEVSFRKLLLKGERLKEIGNDQDNQEVESLKSLIGLYLTICYLIVKGIVNVNSVYLLAWSAYERDMYYLYNEDMEDKNTNHDYLKAATDFYNNKSCYQKRHKYLIKDIEEARQNSNNLNYKDYRNKVCHYNICTSFMDYANNIGKVSCYFDIYNYCFQRYFAKKNDNLSTLLDTYNCYNKDYLKLLNMPFAYNMARYKNLTIADLFNDKYPSENKEATASND